MGIERVREICKNVTTRRTVVIADGSPSWDCEDAGLSVRPGDRLQITITGQAD